MQEKSSLVVAWLRKARSDEIALDASLNAGAPDAACFHAQQCAEKYLKALLIHVEITFPFTHNLVKLTRICAAKYPPFFSLVPIVEPLTPYAVELRYDAEFWPTTESAKEARLAALAVKEQVLRHLPEAIVRQVG